MKRIFLSAAILLMFGGCSIKEDRTDCPCILMIDFTGVDPSFLSSADVNAIASGHLVYGNSVQAADYTDVFPVSVPRSGIYLSISNGSEGCFSPERGFTVALGDEFPPLYLQTGYFNTDCETIGVYARMFKSYCNITIRLATEGVYPYSLLVEGNVNGYGIEGAVLEGPFSYSPVPDENGVCSVRVPRQTDSSLMLKIREDDTLLREFAIGEYIEMSGYDWSSPDLEDVEIEIDYSKTDVIFKVNDWEKTVSFDVVI